MNITYIGALAKYAYRLSSPPEVTSKLRLTMADQSSSIWILDDAVLTSCCIPSFRLSTKSSPGQSCICFRPGDSDTVWALDRVENQKVQERMDLVFGYRKELASFIALLPFIVTNDYLPDKSTRRRKSAGDLYEFDKRVEDLELLRKTEEARHQFCDLSQPINASRFESLLTHYGLWKKVQPRVKHFIRSFLIRIHPIGRHEHHHPVGLTELRRLELHNMAKEISEIGKAGLIIKKEHHEHTDL